MGIEKSGKVEEGTKVEKMPGRAWGKAEEISKNRSLRILFFGWRGPLSVMGKNRFLQGFIVGLGLALCPT
jgi:hypothetical protein